MELRVQVTKKPSRLNEARALKILLSLSGEVFCLTSAVFANGGNTVIATGFGLVLLGLADDLAVAGFEDKVEFVVGGFFLFEVGFVATVFGDGGDAILGTFLVLVALRLKDDFAIASFETEVEFLGFFALEEFVHCCLGGH